MTKFKFKQEELVSMKKLKKDPSFTLFIDSLSSHLNILSKQMRASVEPNQMLKLSGMAKQIEDILDSVKSV